MNFERFIAQKMIGAGSDNTSRSGTRTIIRIAILGIALSMAVMLVTNAVVTGFQSEIRAKVIGFGGHLQIGPFQNSSSLESNPIAIDQPFYPSLNDVPGVNNIQVYASKAGIIQTEEEIQGVLVKGVHTDFNWEFFKKHLKEGEILAINDSSRIKDMLVSRQLSNKLNLKLGDKILMVFIANGVERKRQFVLTGVYETGLEQFDRSVVLADIKHVQRLNGFEKDEVSGFEVIIDRYEDLNKLDDIVEEHVGYELNTVKITDRHSDIFGWLQLQDINVIIIISLMILVSAINMCSALLILILERTRLIGILKSLGSSNWSIRKIFLYNAAYLIAVGLFLGNLLGLILCWLQDEFGLLKLPVESYYISTVPIHFDGLTFALLNLGTLLLCTLIMILPTYVVTKISPVKAIRFD